MDMDFLIHIWYSLNTMGSALGGGAFLSPSIITKPMETKAISILSYQIKLSCKFLECKHLQFLKINS